MKNFELIGIIQRGSWYTVTFLQHDGKTLETHKMNGWRKLNRFLKYNNIFHTVGKPFCLPANNRVVSEIVAEQTMEK